MKPLTVSEQLRLMTSWLKEGRPFFHTRYNDGEATAMFGLKGENDVNTDGHRYFRDMGRRLTQTYHRVCCASAWKDNIIVGSWWPEDPTHEAAELLQAVDAAIYVRWCHSDLWFDEQAEAIGECAGEELMEFLGALLTRPLVVVGCEALFGHAEHVPTEADNAWDEHNTIIREAMQAANGTYNNVFLWACGFTGKVASEAVWNAYPNTTHIDVGALLSALAGNPIRDWMKKPNGTHWRYLQDVVVPKLRSV